MRLEVRARKVAVALTAAALVVAGCGGGDEDSGGGSAAGGECEDPIRIGRLATLTGPNAPLGAQSRSGTETALAILEERYPDGLLGCAIGDIEVVEVDDAGDPAQGLQAARDLIERQEVDVLITAHPSTVGLAVAEYVNESEIPMLSLSTNEGIYDTSKFPYNYAFGVTGGPTSEAVAAYAEQFGFERIFIAMEDSAYGEGQYAAVSPALKEVGIEEAGYIKFPAAAADLTSFAQQVKDAQGDFDAFYYCAQPAQMGRFTQALATVGMDGIQFGCQSFTGPEYLVAAAGTLPLGSVGISQAPLLTQTDIENVAEFVDAFKAIEDREPATDSFTYSMVVTWADAVERAGTTDGPEVKAALDETEGFLAAQNAITFTEDDHLSFDDPEEDFTPIFLVDADELTCSPPSNGVSFCDPASIKEAGLELPEFAAGL